jgi:WD40 repeat protein
VVLAANDIATYTSMLTHFTGPGFEVTSVAFSPDGKSVACRDTNGSVRAFDLASFVVLDGTYLKLLFIYFRIYCLLVYFLCIRTYDSLGDYCFTLHLFVGSLFPWLEQASAFFSTQRSKIVRSPSGVPRREPVATSTAAATYDEKAVVLFRLKNASTPRDVSIATAAKCAFAQLEPQSALNLLEKSGELMLGVAKDYNTLMLKSGIHLVDVFE